jgi:Mn2+/Fe2+ NRAMP family transporter
MTAGETRGIVFIMVALLLAGAALRQSPTRAGGIDDALQSLSALGKWPFTAIAVGLIAYGAYELLNARYRRIRID